MNKKIIITIIAIIAVIGGFFLLRGEEEKKLSGIEEAREVAENWIVNNSPTYTFDGSGLALQSEEELAEEETYLFVFSFESRAAGYGDRTSEMAAQVITSHTVEIIVQEGEVVSAVTDGDYDEMKREMTEEALPETMKIDLYFIEVIDGQEEIVKVEREIPYTPAVGRASIEELLEGPPEGLSTAIKEEAELQSINIEEGTAFVDFNEKLEEGVAGSAMVMAIREQIEKTLLQFNTVDEVVISINGRTGDIILQP